MNNSTLRQIQRKLTVRSKLIIAFAVTLLLITPLLLFALRSYPANAQTQAATGGAEMMPSGDQYTNIPYFTEQSSMTSTLTLNNNETEAMAVTVTVFNSEGKRLVLPAITLKPQLAARFSLKKLIGNADGNFSSGNIQVFYHGEPMAVTSQVTIVSANRRLAFDSMEAMDFASSRLDGIVWVPDADTRTSVAMTNTSLNPLTVTAVVNQTAKKQIKPIILNARETRVLDLNDHLGTKRDVPVSALISLEHNGAPGALIATGFALNEKTGFSANVNFVDCEAAKSTHLAGAHVRFGQADPLEGFPAGTTFHAPLVIANTMDAPTEAHIFVDYTLESAAKRVELQPVMLAAREVRQIELSDEMARQGVIGPVEDAGVDITYNGMIGTVIGRLTSVSASGDYAFDVPIKDPLAGMGRTGGSYPWRLDKGYSSIVHLKNTLDKQVNAVVQIRYDGGTYNPEMIKLAPYQTVAIDIRQLRDAQKKDVRGEALPKDIASGQVVWFERKEGSLIGRAEISNIGDGVASSFSCPSGCCPPGFYSASMTPSSFSSAIGDQFYPPVHEMDRDCRGVMYGPYDMTGQAIWSSSDTSIVDTNMTAISEGSADIIATWDTARYSPSGVAGCIVYERQAQTRAPVTVNASMSILTNATGWRGYNFERPYRR